MYKAVAQSVLLYVSKVLQRFHNLSARRITGMAEKRGAVREWGYPSVVEAMEVAGLHPIGVYIRRQQANIP